MTYDLTGRVAAVNTIPLGDTLDEPAPVGSTVLIVEDASDFDEAGGVLRMGEGGEVVVYDEVDDEGDAIHLATPLARAYEIGDRVEVFDPTVSAPVTETIAQIFVEGSDSSHDPLEATVDHALIPFLPEGIRDLDPVTGLPGETVSLVWRGEDLYVVNLIGQPVVFDGTVIDPTTLPEVEIPEIGPTEPPAFTPALTVTGTAEGLVVRAAALSSAADDSLTYYLATGPLPVDAEGEPVPFTPSSATQVGAPTRSTIVYIAAGPDGGRLDPAATYYVRAVASNSVGSAPAGPMSSGALDPSVVSDLVTGTVSAGFALLGAMQVGEGITIHPDDGIRLTRPGGDIHLPSNPAIPAEFSGTVTTDDLTVEGGLAINGGTNFVNGALELASTTAKPSVRPVLRHTWDRGATLQKSAMGIDETADGTKWVFAHRDSSELRFSLKGSPATASDRIEIPGCNVYNVVRVSSWVYALCWERATADWYVYRINTSTMSRIGSIRVATKNQAGSIIPGIGTDGTRVMVAWALGDDRVTVRSYTTALDGAGAQTWTIPAGFDHTISATSALYSVGRAPVGPNGETRGYVISNGVPILYDDTNTAIAYLARPEGVKGWFRNSSGGFTGLGWDSAQTIEFPVTYWTGQRSVAFSWFDSDTTGGQHETEVGPAASYWPWDFSLLAVDVPRPADTGKTDDPDSVRIYIDGHRQAALAPGVTSARYARPAVSNLFPPSTNGFLSVTGNPGEIRSGKMRGTGSNAVPSILLRGDGSGGLGGSTWDASGIMLSPPGAPGQITLWAGEVAPPGWYFCQGQEAYIADFPVLAALLGSRFGAASASDRFKFPDLRGRFPIGAMTGGFAALGDDDGVTSAGSRTPQHTHGDNFAVSTTVQSNTATQANSANRVTVVRLSGSVNQSGRTSIPFLGVHFIIRAT